MKNLPLSSAINNQLNDYYSSLADSETPLNGTQVPWLDLSPFVSYMLDAFERCLIHAALSVNKLNPKESRLLERMNRVDIHAEITVANASRILELSDSATRKLLNGPVQKGYLTIDTASLPYNYRLEQHIPDTPIL